MTDKHIPASKLLALPRFSIFKIGTSAAMVEHENGRYVNMEDLQAIIDEAPEVESVRCVYGEQIGMPEYSCANKCQYASNHSTDLTKLVGELSDALERAQNGLRWYADEHPKDASEADGELHEEIDSLLTRAKEYLK